MLKVKKTRKQKYSYKNHEKIKIEFEKYWDNLKVAKNLNHVTNSKAVERGVDNFKEFVK